MASVANGAAAQQEQAAMAMTMAAAAASAADATDTPSGSEGGVMDESGDGGDYDDENGRRAKRGFSKRVTLRDLERYFEYPIEEVSKMMGVSTTIIKRLCRKYGIKRWPYRQIRSVNKSIKYVELLARTALGADRERLQEQLVSLHYKKQLICQAATTGASAKVRKSILQMRPEELDADTLLRSGVPGGPAGGGGAETLGSEGGISGLSHHNVAGPNEGVGEGEVTAEEQERAAAIQVAASQAAAAGQQFAAMQQAQQAASAPHGAEAAAQATGPGPAGGAGASASPGNDPTDPQSAEAAHAAATQAAAAAAAVVAASQAPYGMPPHMQMAGMAMGYSPYVHMAAAAQAQQAMAHHQQGEGLGAPGGGGGGTSQAGGTHMHAYGHLGMYGGYPGIMGLPYTFQPHGYPGMPGYGVPGMGGYPSLAGGSVGTEQMTPSIGMSGMAAMQLAAQTMQQQQHEQQEAMYHEHQQRQQEEAAAAAAAAAAAVSEAAPTSPVNPVNTRFPPEPLQTAESGENEGQPVEEIGTANQAPAPASSVRDAGGTNKEHVSEELKPSEPIAAVERHEAAATPA